jgi:hypothetical protein
VDRGFHTFSAICLPFNLIPPASASNRIEIRSHALTLCTLVFGKLCYRPLLLRFQRRTVGTCQGRQWVKGGGSAAATEWPVDSAPQGTDGDNDGLRQSSSSSSSILVVLHSSFYCCRYSGRSFSFVLLLHPVLPFTEGTGPCGLREV